MMTRSATPLAARGGRGEASSEGREEGEAMHERGEEEGKPGDESEGERSRGREKGREERTEGGNKNCR